MARTRSYRRDLFHGCLVFGFFCSLPMVSGQLPDESVLPGANDRPRPTRALPDESVLPTSAFSQIAQSAESVEKEPPGGR